MSAFSALFTALMLLNGPAKPSLAAKAAEGVRAILGISVNTANAGESLVIILDGGRDVLLQPSVLREAGLKALKVSAENVDGKPYVSLAAITPKLQFEVDDAALTLRITAPPALFGLQRIDLRQREPSGTMHLSNAALFANYGVNWSENLRPSVSTEFGASAGSALLVSTLSRSGDGYITRGLTTLTIDNPSAMRRIAGGDIAMRGGPLWTSGLITGISANREFSLDPYFIQFPTPRLTQTLSTPSTVDVYVNDRLVRRTELAPGVFDITGIPALAGVGQTRVVVRDGFGRSQSFDTSYYVTSAVLAKGLHDFQYAIGSRQRYTRDDLNHRQAVSLTHRAGLTNSVTAGVHAEGDRTLVSGGPTLTARIGTLGDVEASMGVSRLAGGRTGRAASVAWSYLRHSTSVSMSARVSTGSFVSFGESVIQAHPRVEWAAGASTRVMRIGSVSVNVQQQWLPSQTPLGESSWRRIAHVSGGRRITERLQMQWRAGQTWTSSTHNREASIGVVLSLGRTSASSTVTTRAAGVSADVTMTRPLPIDTGLGFRVRGDSEHHQVDGAVQAQNHVARAELQFYRLDGLARPSVMVSGGVVVIDRSLAFTNGLGESYALVEVPGVKGVRVYANNTEVGRTGRNGKLLVPRMLPNYANRLAISDLDLPADRTAAEAEKLVAPPNRGGAVVTFHEEQMQAAVGRVTWIDADGQTIPAFGVLSVSVGKRTIESPIAMDGAFFLEQLPSGRYSALVVYHGDECLATIVVPPYRGTLVDVGAVTCRVR